MEVGTHEMRFLLVLLFATFAVAGEYTTYIGDAYPRTVAAIATDAAGNTYVAGNRGTEVPVVAVPVQIFGYLSPVPVTSVPPNDVFVNKVDPAGNVLFTAAFAGKDNDRAFAVAVDLSGNIYVGGSTTSPDFPLSNALQSQTSQFGAGFIVKLSRDGKSILYSTYFGGLDGSTTISAMTTDAAGNLYLTGTTFAGDFPHTNGMPSAIVTQTGRPSTSAAFVTSISSAGDKILFSGTVGGTETACASDDFHDCMDVPTSTTGIALALDASQNVYFGGNTNTIDMPTTSGAFVTQGMGAFAGKIAANGTGLSYLTYLSNTQELASGPLLSGANVLSALAADSAGNVYLAGSTGDPKFPATPGSFQPAFAGGPVNTFGVPANTDGFIARLNPQGSTLVWATYLGGNGNDALNSIAVDGAGDVWANGTTASTNFPNTQGWSAGGDFLVELNASGSALPYSARYPNGTVSQALALNATTFIHTAGATGIVSEIASNTAPSMKLFGIGNAAGGPLAGRVSPAEVISLYGPHIGPATAVTAVPVNGFYPTALDGLQVVIGGIPAPLLYASDGQINAVVPMELTAQTGTTVQVIKGIAAAPAFPLWVDTSDVGAFYPVLNQDWSINSQTNPAKAGSIVIFYATGSQISVAPLLKDGQIATQAVNDCANGACPASQGTVLYGGPAPGIVEGVEQFNLQLTSSVTGLQQLSTFVSNLAFVTVWVTP